MNDDHLAVGIAVFHHAVRLSNFLKLEDPGRLRLQFSLRDLACDVLQRHVRKRKAGRSKNEAAEERQIDAACHL